MEACRILSFHSFRQLFERLGLPGVPVSAEEEHGGKQGRIDDPFDNCPGLGTRVSEQASRDWLHADPIKYVVGGPAAGHTLQTHPIAAVEHQVVEEQMNPCQYHTNDGKHL